jgi:ABC-type Fe3+/spermidine/putrescine transport system ATPase subunit
LSDAILELDALSKRFGPTVTADRLSLRVERGEFFTFLGPSGSGKSTILRMIAGLEQPDGGTIRIHGRDVAGVPPWKRNLGMVFQQYAVFPHMTVAENVGYGLKVRKLSASAIGDKVIGMLQLIGLAGMEGKNVTLLSGGEQQRVALARALVLRPDMLLLDEPLSALDEKIRREMQTELKHLQRKTGTTFLYVTHDQEEALTMSDRIAVLNRGVCVQCDAPERLFRRPRTRFVAGFFRGCNVVQAELVGAAQGRADLRIAGSVAASATNGSAAAGAVALAIRAENIRLGAGAATCATRLTAMLEEVVYRGTNVDHVLRLADGQRLVATSTRREIEGGPREVAIGCDADDVILLED